MGKQVGDRGCDRILVPLDGSAIGEQALPHAVALATAFGSRIVLARVPETTFVPVMSAGLWVTREVESQEAQDHAAHYLKEIAARDELGGLVERTMIPHHPVAAGLIDAIEECGADLVVLTSHGRSGIGRWVFGSTADKLVHAAPTPVYLVRAQDKPPHEPAFRTIMVPLDGSELSEVAVGTAVELAIAAGARLHLARVPTVPGHAAAVAETAGWIPDLLRQTTSEAESYLAELAASLQGQGCEVTSDVEVASKGGVAEALLGHARRTQADLIVMSSHGRSGIGRWVFGSVTDRVTRASDVPVWLVRAGIPSEAA